jgi:hypothetical protein
MKQSEPSKIQCRIPSSALEMNQNPKLSRNKHTRTRRSLTETESRGPERGATGKDKTGQRHHLHLVLDRHLPRGPSPSRDSPSSHPGPAAPTTQTTPSASACAIATVPASPSLHSLWRGDPVLSLCPRYREEPQPGTGIFGTGHGGSIGGGGRGFGRWTDQVAGGGAGQLGVGGLLLRPHASGARAHPAMGHASGACRDAGHPQVLGPSHPRRFLLSRMSSPPLWLHNFYPFLFFLRRTK